MKLHVDIEKDLHSFRLKVSFDTDGEVFAVLGSSGSGKSMTLKCIAGIEKPDRGVVTLGGRVLFDSVSGSCPVSPHDSHGKHKLRFRKKCQGVYRQILSQRKRRSAASSAFRRGKTEDGHCQDAGCRT